MHCYFFRWFSQRWYEKIPDIGGTIPKGSSTGLSPLRIRCFFKHLRYMMIPTVPNNSYIFSQRCIKMVLGMDKHHLTGQNLGRVFNFRSGHFHAAHLWCNPVKLLNLKLKTRPKQLLVSLPLDITLPVWGSIGGLLFSLLIDTPCIMQSFYCHIGKCTGACTIKLFTAVIVAVT